MLSSNTFSHLFATGKVMIACIHLKPLPGAPAYAGSIGEVIDAAAAEAELFKKYGFDGIVVENFRDNPFFPDKAPAETVAAMAVAVREAVKIFGGPVGVNVLRNDAHAALAVATAAGAHFIRVNIHTGTRITDQGMISGKSHKTLRLRSALGSQALIFADVAVKHSYAPGNYPIEQEALDTAARGMADALIVTGSATGKEADVDDLKKISAVTGLPLFIGSGVTPENVAALIPNARGVIIGSWLKKGGLASNDPDEARVAAFVREFRKVTG